MKKATLLLLGILITFSTLYSIPVGGETANNKFVDSVLRENIQSDETLTAIGAYNTVIIKAIGAILIVLFIVIYAVKKGLKKERNDIS